MSMPARTRTTVHLGRSRGALVRRAARVPEGPMRRIATVGLLALLALGIGPHTGGASGTLSMAARCPGTPGRRPAAAGSARAGHGICQRRRGPGAQGRRARLRLRRRGDAAGPICPPSAVVVEHYDPASSRRHPDLGDPDYRKPFEPGNRHGREMAQIVWAITGSDPRGPQFYLLNANGPTMLRRAVRYAIEQDVDIILFSGSFEGGGNGDGRGPINRIVDEALAAGILWINAAGNFGGKVYNGPVRILRDGYLRLGGGTDIAALRFRNRLDENTVTVTLTWNDYREHGGRRHRPRTLTSMSRTGPAAASAPGNWSRSPAIARPALTRAATPASASS